jgi:hypothetical protein
MRKGLRYKNNFTCYLNNEGKNENHQFYNFRSVLVFMRLFCSSPSLLRKKKASWGKFETKLSFSSIPLIPRVNAYEDWEGSLWEKLDRGFFFRIVQQENLMKWEIVGAIWKEEGK